MDQRRPEALIVNSPRPSSSAARWYTGFRKITAPRLLSFALSAFGIIFGILIGYLIAIQPWLERGLNIGSTRSAVILSTIPGGLAVGIILTILFIPHHKPLWIAGSIQISGIFNILTAVAFSRFGSPNLPAGDNVNRSSSVVLLCDESFVNNISVPNTASDPSYTVESDTALVLGIFLWLIGLTAAVPVVVMINQTNFSPERMSLYMLMALGPISGLLLGSSSREQFSRLGSYSAGFIFVGIAFCVIGLFIGLIPKQTITSIMTAASQDRVPGTNINIKDTMRRLGRIMRHRPFVGLLVTLILDVFLISGYVFILPRYIQMQFDVPISIANISVALGMLLPYGFGALVLSFGANFLDLTAKQMRTVSVGCVMMSCFGCLIFVFLGCGAALFDHKRQIVVEQRPAAFVVENICNNKCDCFRAEHYYHPVCHPDTHVTFASPCLAGCTKQSGRNLEQQSFGFCNCVENPARDDRLPATTTWVIDGVCTRECAAAFGAFVFIGCLFHVHSGFPITVLLKEFTSLFIEQESLTVAKHFIVLVVLSFGVVPASIIGGYLLDSTCLLWEKENSRLIGGPVCVVHDESRMRAKIHVMLLLAKILLTSFYYLIFRYLNRPTRYEETASEDVTVYYKSVDSSSTLDLVTNAEESASHTIWQPKPS